MPRRARLALSKSGVSLVSGSLPYSMPAFPSLFDLICMFDVLEHIDDDVASLAMVAESLAPGGCLLLTVPAGPSLWGAHDVVLHHKRRYTRMSLMVAIEKSGLVATRVTHFNTLLFPLAWLARMAKVGVSAGMTPPPDPINSLFANIMASERKLLNFLDLPYGLSLMAIVRRG